jgi:hypothetical protein
VTDDADRRWEQQRLELRADMREGFAQLNSRFDQLVTTKTFEAELRRIDDRQGGIEDDIQTLFAARETDRRRRSQDLMVWVIAGVGWLVTLIIAAMPYLRGGG